MSKHTTKSSVVSTSTEDDGNFSELTNTMVEYQREVVQKRYDERIQKFQRSGRESLTAKELLRVDSFREIMEIHTSLERIEQIQKLSRISPLKRLDMDKVEYLQFLIEAYYQELYILELRIDRWLKWHERKFKKSDLNRAKFRKGQSLVASAFKSTR